MNSTLKYILLAACAASACDKKPAEAPVSPASSAPQIISGLYTSAREGDCLCVNAEKKIAGTTQTLAAMGGDVNLNKGFDSLDKDDGRRAGLLESFQVLKPAGKDSIRYANTLYVRVNTAKNCEVLNTRILSAVNYAQACLGDESGDIRVEPKKLE